VPDDLWVPALRYAAKTRLRLAGMTGVV